MDALHVVRIATAAAVALSPASAGAGGHHWSYSGEGGPAHWAQLDPHFAACAAGKVQSPIDIRTHDAHRANLPGLEFRYQPSALHVIDNGHTIQFNYDPGSALLVGGKRYELIQIHFHRPSEESIDGKHFAMVAHLVHRDPQGHLAVVAVPLETGHANALIETLWRNLPKVKEQVTSPKNVSINASTLLPASHSYYAFMGSLTTPPCSEDVHWMVLKSPTLISRHELAVFAEEYPDDARPTQPLNGREVLVSK